MSDLAAFLKARLAEDEALARAVPANETWDVYVMSFEDRDYDYQGKAESLEQAGRWSPARVLAEVEAKRVVLAMQELALRYHPAATSTCPSNPRCACDHCIVVRALAQPYADHPDFDPTWRVS